MMAIDMKAEGVTVNPLRGITGDAHFNEVFFDDVFVPDEDVVGDVNKGWLVARATLGNERISIGGGSGGQTGFDADDLVKLLDSVPADVAAQHVRRAGEVIAELHTLRLLNLRRASRAIAGAEPGPEGNVTKLLVAESGQHLTELGIELAGSAAVVGCQPEADPQLHGQQGDDDRGRHVGDHPQHHRRAHPRPAPRPAAEIGPHSSVLREAPSGRARRERREARAGASTSPRSRPARAPPSTGVARPTSLSASCSSVMGLSGVPRLWATWRSSVRPSRSVNTTRAESLSGRRRCGRAPAREARPTPGRRPARR